MDIDYFLTYYKCKRIKFEQIIHDTHKDFYGGYLYCVIIEYKRGVEVNTSTVQQASEEVERLKNLFDETFGLNDALIVSFHNRIQIRFNDEKKTKNFIIALKMVML